MGAAVVADRDRGCGRDDEVEGRHDEDELAAKTPGVVRRHAGHLANPPAVAVELLAPTRAAARHERLRDPASPARPGSRCAAPRLQIELAELHHLPWRQQHVVAAEVHPLWILRPARERKPERLRERLLRELPRADARRLRQDRRQDVRVPGAVLHRRARGAFERACQGVPHPVRALDPRAVVPVARRGQARPHASADPRSSIARRAGSLFGPRMSGKNGAMG